MNKKIIVYFLVFISLSYVVFAGSSDSINIYEWKMFARNLNHASVYPGNVDTNNLELSWTNNIGSPTTVYPSSSIANGIIYAGSDNNKLYALNINTGNVLWTFLTDGAVSAAPVISNGIVYVGTVGGTFYAIDSLTGLEVWKFESIGQVHAAATVVDDVVYVGGTDSKVYALNANDGSLIWTFSTGGIVKSVPTVIDGVVYVGDQAAGNTHLYAIDSLTGTKIWDYGFSNYIASSPAVVEGVVYVGSMDFSFYAIDTQTGIKIWDYPTGYYVSSSPAIKDGIVYFGNNQGNIFALDSTTGSEIWKKYIGGIFSNLFVASEDKLFAGNMNGKMYAFDLSTGDIVWSYNTPHEVRTQPNIIGGNLYFIDSGGDIYAFKSPHQCSDSRDNDGDGLIDYPEDPGCDSAEDDNEIHYDLEFISLEYAPNSIVTPSDVNYNITLNYIGDQPLDTQLGLYIEGTYLGTLDITNLQPNQMTIYQGLLSNFNFFEGNFTVDVILDPSNTLQEPDELNNEGSFFLSVTCSDCDKDGYNNDVDCNDRNEDINPGAQEICYNGIDDNCNGLDNEGENNEGCFDFYLDNDYDGDGVPGSSKCLCAPEFITQYDTQNNKDCDDTNPSINQWAEEICNGEDDNCNGQTDEEPYASNSCTDYVPCTEDICSEGICQNNANNALCDDNLFCNGLETCNPLIGCEIGTPIDCSANDLQSISLCTYNPDNNPLTWDLFAGFTSTCNEVEDACTTGSVSILNSCSMTNCGAECETNSNCPITDCNPLDGCFSGEYRDYGIISNLCLADCTCTSYTCDTYQSIGTDIDGDNWDTECGDCDDNDINVNPSATEIIKNGKDDDCNPLTLDIPDVCDASNICTKTVDVAGTPYYCRSINGVWQWTKCTLCNSVTFNCDSALGYVEVPLDTQIVCKTKSATCDATGWI